MNESTLRRLLSREMMAQYIGILVLVLNSPRVLGLGLTPTEILAVFVGSGAVAMSRGMAKKESR